MYVFMCFHCGGRENIKPQWSCDWLEIGKYNHKHRKSSGILMNLLKNYRKKVTHTHTQNMSHFSGNNQALYNKTCKKSMT